jgi:type IV pilus assembly protein PilV
VRADRVPPRRRMRREAGALLVEALVAILLFSVAILGLVGLQVVAIGTVRDTHYRSEASYLANQLVGLMWTHLDRRTPDAAIDTFCAFAMSATLAPGCPVRVVGTPAILQAKADWLASVAKALPNADAAAQRVEVDAIDGKRVVVTLSWRAPQDVAPRRHVVTANVN